MKKLLMGVFSFVIILLLFLIIFTISGKNIRQTELDGAFDSSMKYAMQLLQLEEGAPQTEEEWKVMFVDSLRIQIKSASDLEVNILYADMEKGILSAEAILHFTHPNGERAMVSKSGTIYLEEYEADTSGS